MSGIRALNPKWPHLVAPKRLKHWRTRILRTTQRQAAERIGIDHSKYCAFEGRMRRPCLDVAVQIELVTRGHVLATQWAQAFDLDVRRAKKAS